MEKRKILSKITVLLLLSLVLHSTTISMKRKRDKNTNFIKEKDSKKRKIPSNLFTAVQENNHEKVTSIVTLNPTVINQITKCFLGHTGPYYLTPLGLAIYKKKHFSFDGQTTFTKRSQNNG